MSVHVFNNLNYWNYGCEIVLKWEYNIKYYKFYSEIIQPFCKFNSMLSSTIKFENFFALSHLARQKSIKQISAYYSLVCWLFNFFSDSMNSLKYKGSSFKISASHKRFSFLESSVENTNFSNFKSTLLISIRSNFSWICVSSLKKSDNVDPKSVLHLV